MTRAIPTITFALLACTAVQHVHSHALWDPQGLVKPRSNRDDIKTGPCGEPRGNSPVTLAAGATVSLSIERTIYHQGYFRIAFSPSNDQGFDNYVLADRVPENSSQRFYNVSVTLPDMECESCTLQLIQVMLDRNPPTNYYSCADIRLVRATPGDTQPPASVTQVLPIAADTEVRLNWTNPQDEDFAGVLIVESDAVLNTMPEAGAQYAIDASLGNGKVAFFGAATDLLLSSRTPGHTYHYSLFAFDQAYNYAAAVTTSIELAAPLPNVAPSLELVAEQGGQITQNISTARGLVTVQAQIGDANSGDQHQVIWSVSDNRLVNLNSAAEQFTFDPQSLAAGEYQITATVTDNGNPPLTTSSELTLILTQPEQSRGGSSGGLLFWILVLTLARLCKSSRR